MRAGAGQVIGGHYRLVEPIGRGGFAEVWRARDERLHRDVAAKRLFLPAHFTGRQRAERHARTLREARTAARLAHPAVVTVYEVVADRGDLWLVMELIRGRSLAALVRAEGPLPPRQAAALGLRLLGALRAAHEVGVLHRDVKPANVLVGDGRVVLGDFGLAVVEGDPGLTCSGIVMGAPAYTAPERARGEPAVAASDLWSLGATLFYAVEGRRPFEAPNANAMLHAILTRDPVPASHAGPLAPVIEGLLRKDPAARLTAARAAPLLARAAGTSATGDPDDTPATYFTWAYPAGIGVRDPDLSGTGGPGAEIPAALPPVPPGDRAHADAGRDASGPGTAPSGTGSADLAAGDTAAGTGPHGETAHGETHGEAGPAAGTTPRGAATTGANAASARLGRACGSRADGGGASVRHRVAAAPDGRPAASGRPARRRRAALPAIAAVVAAALTATAVLDRTVRAGPAARAAGAPAVVRLVTALPGAPDRILALTTSPDGHTLAAAGADRTLRLWDTTGHRPATTLARTGGVLAAAFSPHGRMLAIGGGGRVTLWSTRRWRRITALDMHGARVDTLSFGPDGTLLTGAGGNVRLWNVPGGRPAGRLPVDGEPVSAAAFAPRGHTLATAGAWTLRLWKARRGPAAPALVTRLASPVAGMAFSADGRTLATGGYDGRVRLWDVRTGRPVATLPALPGKAGVAFSPDGRLLATAGGDVVLVWDMPAGTPAATLRTPPGPVEAIAFTPDGLLATAGGDATVRLWRLDPAPTG